MGLLDSYKSLSSESTPGEVEKVLSSITNALSPAISQNDRDQLVKLLLKDIQCSLSIENRKSGRLAIQDARLALLALKTLGRVPASSKTLSEQENLKTLLNATEALRNVDSAGADEALRCVANALLLIEGGRANWVNVRGAIYCVDLLDESTSVTCIFLCCRILFLSTASVSSPLLKSLLDYVPRSSMALDNQGTQRGIVDVFTKQSDFLLNGIFGGVEMSKEALVDLLKFAFNLLCHWPKIAPDAEYTSSLTEQESKDHVETSSDDRTVLGDRWTARLDGMLPPLRRLFLRLPPTTLTPLAPPLTHVLHSLIPIPINERLYQAWFPDSPEFGKLEFVSIMPLTPDIPPSGKKSTNHSTCNSSIDSEVSIQSTSRSGPPSKISCKGKEKEGDSRGADDRVLSRPTSPLDPRASSFAKDVEHSASPPEILGRCLELFDASLLHYLPGSIDPDDASVKLICSQEDVQLDQILTPLVLLLLKFCDRSTYCRVLFKGRILPNDLDRSTPLEGRPDMLGRCIRLMSCATHSQLKSAVGELLFVVCDSDAQILSGQIGYGNAAGLLYNKGVMSAPQRTSSNSPGLTDQHVDPITGMIRAGRADQPDMTEEEKEREAEKLFVLFERLEKSGGMENPLKKALHDGRLEIYRDRRREEDD